MHASFNFIAGLLALGLVAVAAPAAAQNPAQEQSCSIRGWDGPCRPDLVPAHNPLPQPQNRPWERPAATPVPSTPSTRPGGG